MARSIELGQLNHERHLDGISMSTSTPNIRNKYTENRLQLTQRNTEKVY